jgi:hypothetical protein
VCMVTAFRWAGAGFIARQPLPRRNISSLFKPYGPVQKNCNTSESGPQMRGRTPLPEQPAGCCAQRGPSPLPFAVPPCLGQRLAFFHGIYGDGCSRNDASSIASF